MPRSERIRRLQSGPAEASTSRCSSSLLNIQQIFERHHDEIYRYVARLTGDPDLAADIAQETFIRWVENAPDQLEARAWLFKVATNLCRDHVRVNSRRIELLKEAPESTPIGSAPLDPHRNVEAMERRDAVRDVLGSLPEKDRVILLMQQEGFSHKEIAEAVGTTTGSVGTMLARALQRFSDAVASRLEALR